MEPNETVATCHSLPCNIDYTGPAPGVDVYFQPMDLPTSSQAEKVPNATYQAVSLRGRGLLSKVDDRNTVNGHVMRLQSNLSSDGVKEERNLQSIRYFDKYLEWHHEHQTSVLQNLRSGSKLDRAREWMDTAEALHAPLPCAPNSSTKTC
jgi:hypothetical protein